MSSFPTINASTPPTKPAEAEKQYPYWQATQIVVQSPQPGSAMMVDVRFRAYRLDADNHVEMSPNDAATDDLGNGAYQRRLRGDARKMAATYPEVQAAIESLLTAFETAGQGEGLL
jgi:hypothetical protein